MNSHYSCQRNAIDLRVSPISRVYLSLEPIDKYEQTLILLKPDAEQRKLVGKIIERFEDRGLQLIALKLILVSGIRSLSRFKTH